MGIKRRTDGACVIETDLGGVLDAPVVVTYDPKRGHWTSDELAAEGAGMAFEPDRSAINPSRRPVLDAAEAFVAAMGGRILEGPPEPKGEADLTVPIAY